MTLESLSASFRAEFIIASAYEVVALAAQIEKSKAAVETMVAIRTISGIQETKTAGTNLFFSKMSQENV